MREGRFPYALAYLAVRGDAIFRAFGPGFCSAGQSIASGSGMNVSSGIRKAARPRQVRSAPGGRSSSRVNAPPGGFSSFTFG